MNFFLVMLLAFLASIFFVLIYFASQRVKAGIRKKTDKPALEVNDPSGV